LSAKQYAAPWADQLPDGDLIEYGPSPSTYARQLARHKLWTWHPEKLAARVARTTTADAIRAYMRPTRHLRGDVAKRETEVYLLIYEHGRSIRWAARHLGISRSSVKVYVRRLARRAQPAKENP
jgi:DNA-binding NarL/FixJ family response regulator